jgi:hypothetical protein
MDEIIKRDREIEWTYAEELVGKETIDAIRKAAGM